MSLDADSVGPLGTMYAMERRFPLIFWMTVGGGVVLAVSDLLPIPLPVMLAGAVVFGVGVVTMGLIVGADARRSDRSWLQSLWKGVRASIRWLFVMSP